MATADELTEALDAFYERSIRPEFARLEARVERLAADTAKRLQDVMDRIDAVRESLEAFRIETNDRLADLYGKFKGLEDEYHLIAGRKAGPGGAAPNRGRGEARTASGPLTSRVPPSPDLPGPGTGTPPGS